MIPIHKNLNKCRSYNGRDCKLTYRFPPIFLQEHNRLIVKRIQVCKLCFFDHVGLFFLLIGRWMSAAFSFLHVMHVSFSKITIYLLFRQFHRKDIRKIALHCSIKYITKTYSICHTLCSSLLRLCSLRCFRNGIDNTGRIHAGPL